MLNEKIQKLIDDGYEIKMSDYISEGFDLFKKYPGGFIGFLIIVGTISIVGAFIPFVGSIISVVVQPPLFIGFFIVADKIKYGETYQFSDFFSGFNKNISGLVLASLVGAILIVLGFICLILPGIYLAISYGFSSQLVYFKGFEFWSAL